MVDDVTLSIAAAVAGGAAESLTESAKTAVKKLRATLRHRFSENSEAAEALAAARDDDGEDSTLVAELAAHLDTAQGRDSEIQRLVDELRPHFTVDAGSVHNTVHGDVSGDVIQARDIDGGVNISR